MQGVKAKLQRFFVENILKFSTSLYYSTVFAIGPLLLIIVSQISFFFGNRESAQDRILNQFSCILGTNVTQQLDQILNSFNDGENSILVIITGTVILTIGALFNRLNAIEAGQGIHPKENTKIIHIEVMNEI